MYTEKEQNKIIERMLKNSEKLSKDIKTMKSNSATTKNVENKRVVVTISDGDNLKNKIVKRGYLKADEMNNFLLLHVVSQILTGQRKAPSRMGRFGYEGTVWDDWLNKGIITKEQKKNLKMANTYIRKFVDDAFTNNLDVKTKDTVVKKSSNWSFRLMDDYTVQKIYRMLEAKKEFSLTKDEFFDFVEAKMEMSCKGCTKNRCECKLHDLFDANFVPPINEDKECPNCEYAY